MATGFIQAHLTRASRGTLQVGLLLTIVGAVLAFMTQGRHMWFYGFFLVIGVATLIAWLRRRLNPYGHPLYKQLARYGDVEPLVQQVNEEFTGIKPDNGVHFSAHWLAQSSALGLDLIPWQEIVWLFTERIYQSNVACYYVQVYGRYDRCVAVDCGICQEKAEQMLNELHARAPWAEAGYTPELGQLWNQQRDEFLRRVDTRRQAIPAG